MRKKIKSKIFKVIYSCETSDQLQNVYNWIVEMRRKNILSNENFILAIYEKSTELKDSKKYYERKQSVLKNQVGMKIKEA
jgi:hypothetical protein